MRLTQDAQREPGALSLERLSFFRALRVTQDPKRKAECEALLGDLPGNDFDRLLDLGKRMTDYTPDRWGTLPLNPPASALLHNLSRAQRLRPVVGPGQAHDRLHARRVGDIAVMRVDLLRSCAMWTGQWFRLAAGLGWGKHIAAYTPNRWFLLLYLHFPQEQLCASCATQVIVV